MSQPSTPVSLKQVRIEDPFWSYWQRLINDVVIPYQWQALNDQVEGAEPSHAIHNLKIAAGEAQGLYYGPVFQDSDLYKWLEAVGYVLARGRDASLEEMADGAIELLGRAQWPDGYLNSHYTVVKPDKRWTNVRDDHEMYCAGHLIEAAVAYYEATGKPRVLDIVKRLADHIAAEFGPGPGQKKGYPGHPELELALMKLYRVTKERRYLELAQFFVEERGRRPHYYELEAVAREERRARPYNLDYSQAHLPIKEQKTAQGHSVRAMYLFAGAVDVAVETGDQELLSACRDLFDNVVEKRMYVTGGIGSSAYQEAFTADYDLPGDRAYTETCAAIGLVFFAHRLLQAAPDARYADVIERALYNGILSGIALDGKSYFYVNPLEVWPDTTHRREDMRHVKTVRQPWFGCACCPPNVARLLASLGQYVYSTDADAVYTHLFLSGQVDVDMRGQTVTLTQTTEYPWDGRVTIDVSGDAGGEFAIALRIPGWCRDAAVRVNGQPFDLAGTLENGYARIRRQWKDGDRIELILAMPVEVIRAHPNVRACAGQVALMRGPLVYCLEERDNGANLSDLRLYADRPMTVRHEPDGLRGVAVMTAQGSRSVDDGDGALYRTAKPARAEVEITAIPYYAWANRGENEMTVWVREA